MSTVLLKHHRGALCSASCIYLVKIMKPRNIFRWHGQCNNFFSAGMQIRKHLLVAASRCDFDMQNNCQQLWFWVELFGRGHHREFLILQLCDSKECAFGRLKCCSGGPTLLCSRATSRVQRAGRKIAERKGVPNLKK